MGKSQRTKGAAGEREVCHILRESLGVEASRNLTQTREGGCDIEVGRFNFEVKRRKGIAVHDFMDQAVKSVGDSDRTPVVVCRGDGKEWLCIMRLDDALPLIGNEL
jgi:hypothetical protein